MKDEQGREKKYHRNCLLFIASLGTDNDAMPLAQPLAAGSSNDCTIIPDITPKDVAPVDNDERSDSQTPSMNHIMAAVHSHDSKGPMGWIGKGLNTLSKALTRVLSKEDGQVT